MVQHGAISFDHQFKFDTFEEPLTNLLVTSQSSTANLYIQVKTSSIPNTDSTIDLDKVLPQEASANLRQDIAVLAQRCLKYQILKMLAMKRSAIYWLEAPNPGLSSTEFNRGIQA